MTATSVIRPTRSEAINPGNSRNFFRLVVTNELIEAYANEQILFNHRYENDDYSDEYPVNCLVRNNIANAKGLPSLHLPPGSHLVYSYLRTAALVPE